MAPESQPKFFTTFEYSDRPSKAKYVWLKYGSILNGRILDVAADECHLKQLLPADTEYIGVGLGGNPDIELNLEKQDLPFPDRSFNCVMCLDALEHLDNLHHVFDELCRVSSAHVIISLPNCWNALYIALLHGEYKPGQPTKFYGLPPEPPVDRHKWFFSYTEAERFIAHRAQKNGFRLVHADSYGVIGEGDSVREQARRTLFRKDLDPRDLSVGALWAVISRD